MNQLTEYEVKARFTTTPGERVIIKDRLEQARLKSSLNAQVLDIATTRGVKTTWQRDSIITLPSACSNNHNQLNFKMEVKQNGNTRII